MPARRVSVGSESMFGHIPRTKIPSLVAWRSKLEFFHKCDSDLRIYNLGTGLSLLSLDLLRYFKGLAGETGRKLRFAGEVSSLCFGAGLSLIESRPWADRWAVARQRKYS